VTSSSSLAFGEEGQVGGLEGLVFGLAVFVFGVLVVSNAWAVLDARVAAGAAAREATRAFVESSSLSTDGALAEAEAAASSTIAGYGRDPGRMTLVPESAELVRCAEASFRVEYPVPLLVVPAVGRFGHGFTAVGRFSERVDPFRSGLRDRSECPAELRP
jgi:hypothetical protein